MRRIWHSPWVIFGFLAAVAISALSCIANYVSGTHLTIDPGKASIFGAASVVIDIFEFCLVFAVAGAWARRRYIACGVAIVLLCLCLTWSMKSAADFVSASFSGVLVDRENQGTALQSKREELKALTESQKGLLKASTNDDLPAKDRRAAAQRFDDNAKKIGQLRIDVVQGGTAEAAYPLASALGISNDKLNNFQAALFALILKLGATFGFWCMARASDPPPKVAKQPSGVLTNVTGFFRNTPEYPKISALSQSKEALPHLMSQIATSRSEPAPAVRAARAEQKSSPEKKTNIISFKDRLMRAKNPTDEVFDKPNLPKIPEVSKANVHRFIREMLESEEGTHTASATIFEAYVDWCKSNNIYKPIGHNWLGMFLGQHWDKFNVDRKPWYANVALRPPMVVVEHDTGGESTGT